MKQFITLLSGILFLFHIAAAQYIQGTATRDSSDVNNLKIAFKMKPTGTITTSISYIEAAFRYQTTSTQSFTITNITSNTAVFPGLAVQRLADYIANEYTYVRFVFNTATISSAQYIGGTEYQLFSITTSLPAKPASALNFEMISNQALAQYQFGVVDGAGNLLYPGTGPQLYGTNFRIVGDDHIITIPIPSGATVPVKFSSFQVNKSDKNALLTWTVENQDAGTSYYDIERSVNGSDFTRIGTVRSNLAAGSRATYTFTDPSTGINIVAPVIFYRIKQVDVDGRYVYTDIQNIVLEPGSLGVNLFPNPVLHQAFLSIYLSSPRKVSVEIVSSEGKRIQSFEFAGAVGLNRRQVDVTNLSKGMYNMVVREGNSFKAIRFLK